MKDLILNKFLNGKKKKKVITSCCFAAAVGFVVHLFLMRTHFKYSVIR